MMRICAPGFSDGKAAFTALGYGRADLVVAQTNEQRRGLRERTGIESRVIPMAIAQPEQQLASTERNRVLWIGRISRSKRLEWLLDVAEQCPELQFDVVGSPNTSDAYVVDLLKRAEIIPNITVHGRVSATELRPNLWQHARSVLHISARRFSHQFSRSMEPWYPGGHYFRS